MQIGTICQRNVVAVDRSASILEAARAMRAQHVGDVVIVDDGERPVGIVTDRDIVVELVAKETDLGTVAVGDIMSLTIATANEDADLFETLRFMGVKGVRRLPVIDADGRLVGILSVQDAMQVFLKELNFVTDIATRQVERERRTRA
ncbi:MAG TPA: CBS domain-containing protein [Gammaproteobacteria bacterium]|nr:CBS domain-containing protein [Gammaproteobacteria bacterium]